MVSSSNQRENRIAHDVSSEAAVALGRDVSEPGVNRLAAAIVDAVTSDICEWEACQRLAELPGCTWVFASCNVGYTPQYANADKAPTFSVEAKGDGLCVNGRSRVGFLEAVEHVEKKWADEVRLAARKATIAERIEREMNEADAAEAALKATAPLAFRPDGSPADALPLPVDPFDGVSPADGGGQ